MIGLISLKLKRAHSQKGILQKEHIPKRSILKGTLSRKGTFQKWLIPKRAHSKKSTFQKEHIPKGCLPF
jgi:hypothetical protein